MGDKIKLTVKLAEGEKKRIDMYMKANSGISREKIQKLIDYKSVALNSEIVKNHHTKVRAGDIIEYENNIPQVFTVKHADIPLDIIFEDEYVIGINKQPGLVVHPAPGHYDDTLVNALVGKSISEESYFSQGSRLGIVHRLDKDTSGVMIVAKAGEAYEKFVKLFKEREIKKVYKCLVHGRIEEEGFLDTRISRDEINRRKFTAKYLKGKNAQTLFFPEEIFYNATLLRVEILTGRTHQIRVHMGFMKHEVMGDPQYGDKNKDMDITEYLGYDRNSYTEILPRQLLHAQHLEFTHPFTKNTVSLDANPPGDFTKITDMLRKKNG